MNPQPYDSTVTCCTASSLSAPLRARIEAEATELRAADPAFASWANGYAAIVPKRPVPNRKSPEQAAYLLEHGVVVVTGDPARSQLLLISSGACQLTQALRAHARLVQADISTAAVALAALAALVKLRTPRDRYESTVTLNDTDLHAMLPPSVPRVFVTHTRPEPFLGMQRRLDTGLKTTRALGHCNHSGTLDVDGLLFANRCTCACVVEAAVQVLDRRCDTLLTAEECEALDGNGDPAILQ